MTDVNKKRYLLQLARVRLGGRDKQTPAGLARKQILPFLAGFNSLVDEELLSIFDERELELWG